MVRILVYQEAFYCPFLGLSPGGASSVNSWDSMSNMQRHMHTINICMGLEDINLRENKSIVQHVSQCQRLHYPTGAYVLMGTVLGICS